MTLVKPGLVVNINGLDLGDQLGQWRISPLTYGTAGPGQATPGRRVVAGLPRPHRTGSMADVRYDTGGEPASRSRGDPHPDTDYCSTTPAGNSACPARDSQPHRPNEHLIIAFRTKSTPTA